MDPMYAAISSAAIVDNKDGSSHCGDLDKI